VDLDFYYPVEATPGMPPDRIVVQTVRPISVPLSQHDVVPRNSAGVTIASELKLIGPEVGKTANVSFSLQFVQKGRAKNDP
jgi:hypothetical protein